jgi:transposase
MQMAQVVLGIDVAKETLDVALIDEKRVLFTQVENTPTGHQRLVLWQRKQGLDQVHVCMEATGQYGDGVAEYLYQQGYQVSVVNPARIKYYANSKLSRNKTDKADAKLIAEYCLREKPALWCPPPVSFKRLQTMVRHLDDLQVELTRETNRLSSGVRTDEVIAHLKALIAVLKQQIQETKAMIQAHINSSPDLKRKQILLMSISGIGALTAAKILGEIRDTADFDNARQLSAYAGLTPRNFFSGTSVHKKSCLSKTGNSNLRKDLFLPAIVAKRYNQIVKAFCVRLEESGHRPMEVIGAAMHKLLHLIYGVLKTGRPFDENYLVKTQVHS